ncbi:DMT family transporter [Vibrio sp. IRLE0018]|uniref:DMT family transporter n=1 Tax=Vibrio floridensis TaxID=2908007 RepID=UPI001F29588B|nr:DMT family transporter [Vibrio floridensis]MCF8777350.1 DMT family transporter [Vibrio floridensis]
MPTLEKSVIYMLLSTMSLSVTGLISKALVTFIPVEWFSFIRFALPAVILLFMLRITKLKWPKKEEISALLIRAACIALCQLFFLWSLQHLSLVESVVLFATGPLFMPLLERAFFKSPLSFMTLTLLAITFMGVILLAGHNGEIEWRPEILAGLAGGLFNAGSQLTLYRASKSSMTPKEINFWTFSAAAGLLVPVVVAYEWGASMEVVQAWWNAPVIASLLLMSFLIINTQVNRSKAYRLAQSGSELAPLIFTNLLFTAIWQWLFFEQTFTVWQVSGLAMIISATVVNAFWPKWRARAPLGPERRV